MIKYIFPTQKPHHTRQNKEKDEWKRYLKKTIQYVYTIGINQSDILNIRH